MLKETNFKKAKEKFLGNFLSQYLDRIEYYNQEFNICFNGDEIYLYADESYNSRDFGTNYIYSFRDKIDETIYSISDFYNGILEENDDIKDIFKVNGIDYKEIFIKTKEIDNNKELDKDEKLDEFNNIFYNFNNIYSEVEKFYYKEYISDSFHSDGCSVNYIYNELKEKLDNLSYNEAFKGI